jgi:hypothetical protein
MGRPPLPRGKKRSKMLLVKVTPGEYRLLMAEKRCLGLSLASTILKPWRDKWEGK